MALKYRYAILNAQYDTVVRWVSTYDNAVRWVSLTYKPIRAPDVLTFRNSLTIVLY